MESNLIRETLQRLPKSEYVGRVHTNLMRVDKEYAAAVRETEEHWLSTANSILTEIINEIKNRISRPDTTVTELVKALDTISAKWNLAMGQPTSFEAKVNITKEMKDEELDNRIRELEKHFVPATFPSHQVPHSTPDESGNPLPDYGGTDVENKKEEE